MNFNANNSTTANGARRRARSQSRGGRGRGRSNNTTNSRASSANPSSNRNNEATEQDRDEFIASFQLNILTTSSPILVRNGIQKLGNKCYSAKMVRKYFESSNPHQINIRIVQIWKVHNVGHYAQFMQKNYNDVDNMLLWHGTTRNNLVSILQNSLTLPVAVTNGHMFGPGIYFADRMSKSANYTDKNGPEVFLLCQVALGKKWRVYQAQNFTSAPGDFDTLKAVGKHVPDIGGQEMLGKFCKIPCGRTVTHRDTAVWTSAALQYNEYIVFDQDRIRIKFIVHCERDGNSSSYVAPTIPSSTRTVVRTTNNQNTTPMIQSNVVPKPLAATVRPSTASLSTVRPSTSISSGLMNSQRSTVPSTRPFTFTSSSSSSSTTAVGTMGSGLSSKPSYTAPVPKPPIPGTSFVSSTMTNSYSYPSSSRFSTIASPSYPNYNSNTLRNPSSTYSPTSNESSSICSCCVII